METLKNGRANLVEIKQSLEKRLGPDRAHRYFTYLNGLLSKKFSKTEFDKLVLLTLGRENLHLHNQLIRSVLRNSCKEKPNLPIFGNGELKRPEKRSRVELEKLNVLPNPDAMICSDNRGEFENNSNNCNNNYNYRVPVRPPLGIPLCPASVGGARKSVLTAAVSSGTRPSRNFYETGELSSTEELRRRMESRIVQQGQEGIEGVTLDCANLLNNGLDLYLKRVIGSCFDLVRPNNRQINGIRNNCSVSVQDLRVAMELNHKQLGEDWPLILEKICLCSFKEKD